MTATAAPATDGRTRVWLAGVCFDALTEEQVVDQVIASSLVGRGGWIAPLNVFCLRRAAEDVDLHGLIAQATLRIADGTPLIWANRLGRGAPLVRVTGASLITTLSQAAARYNRSVYYLGGREGAAECAAQNLQDAAPGLKVVGAEGPWLSADLPQHEIEPVIERLVAAQPDIVMMGVGFPKQERFITQCRERLPHTWFLACGAAINFAAKYEPRAPMWMQRMGLEWLHRLCGEPRRLARRYLNDVPFAMRLLLAGAWQGLSRRAAPVVPPVAAPIITLPHVVADAERDQEQLTIDLRDGYVSSGLLDTRDSAVTSAN